MVFQFHGCHWHGCLECFSKGWKEQVNRLGQMQYARKLERGKVICVAGFRVLGA